MGIFSVLYIITSKTGKVDRIINFLKLQNKIPSNAGSLIVAAVIYKAIIPFRIMLTLMVTPLVVQQFNIKIP
jgi:hypothetical protein